MRLYPDTSTWPANYRFAYILVWAGAIITALATIALGFLGTDRMTLAICAMVGKAREELRRRKKR